MNNFAEFLSAFNQVKQNFSGDPKEAVQRIISQNHIPQNELNALQNTASQILRVMK